MKKRNDADRLGAAAGLDSYLSQEKHRLYDAASPQRREQMDAACRAREVYQAWNTVCGKTREGQHVTGLHYAPASNELIVYMDAASWTCEMTLLREIIRARMEAAGAAVSGLVFKTSRAGYESAAQARAPQQAKATRASKPPHVPLTEREEAGIASAVAPIEDAHLREALKNAMEASLSWSKTPKDVK